LSKAWHSPKKASPGSPRLLYITNDEINVFTKSAMSSTENPHETETLLATYRGISKKYSAKIQNQRKYQRVEPKLSSENELLSSDPKVKNLVSKLASSRESFEVLRNKNRHTEIHQDLCSEKINQLFKQLESKNYRNIDLEKKNNAIRSRVLTTCLERDVRKEMSDNKLRWEWLVHDTGDLEPDFKSHSWERPKSIMSKPMLVAERNLQFNTNISIRDDNLQSCEKKYKMVYNPKDGDVIRNNSGSTTTLLQGEIQYLDVVVNKEQTRNKIADYPEVLEVQYDSHHEKDAIENEDNGQKRRLFQNWKTIEQSEEEINQVHSNESSLDEGDEDKKSNGSEKLALNTSNSSTEFSYKRSSGNMEVSVRQSSSSTFLCKPEILPIGGSRKGSSIYLGKIKTGKGSSSVGDIWK